MIRAITLLIIFVLMALYGGYAVVTGVRKIRKPRNYAGALFAWSEHPKAVGWNNLTDWLTISIHRLALVLIGLLAVLNVLLRAKTTFFPPDQSAFWSAATEIMLYVAVGLIGTLWGYSLFGPIAEAIGGDHHYALSNDGLLIAGQLIPWSAFSHFSISEDGRALEIWSASLPGAAGMVTVPSEPGDLQKLSALLRNYLRASDGYSPGTVRRFALPALMAGLSVPFVALAALLFIMPAGVAMLGQSLLMWALTLLGGVLITKLVYGGKTRLVPADEITGSAV